MLLNITDTGFLPALPRLAPSMQRALLIRCKRLRDEQAARRAAIEWHWQRSQELAYDMLHDQHQLRTLRQILHMRGRRS